MATPRVLMQDIKTPLTFHPGERWQYGASHTTAPVHYPDAPLTMSQAGLEWAGIAIERLTGVSLNEYMQTHIFKPLGLKNLNMIPTSEMKAKLAHMNYREASGQIVPCDHLYRQALVVETHEEKARLFNSGGIGLFAQPREYGRKSCFTADAPRFH